MYINNETEDNQGLFAELNGTVKNLTIDESFVKGDSYVGSIAGKNNGTIQKCYNKGTIIGNSEVTGGYLQSSGEIINMWDTDFLTENMSFVSGADRAVVPKGFRVSLNVLEQSISTGMVIQDSNENEFVWIPVSESSPLKVATIEDPYIGRTSYKEPKVLDSNYSSSGAAYDSQGTLDYLYETNYFDYANDFKYEDEYAEMALSVNRHQGFYIGRYETTIDEEENVGSVYNTPVLTTDKSVVIKQGKTAQTCRWYGLYYLEKTTNYVVGNESTVQTAMIYGQLWDKTMDYIRAQKTAGKTTYDVDAPTGSWHQGSGAVNSAQANAGDIALNIYDLEANCWEWIQEAYSTNLRVIRRKLLQL